MTLTWPKDPNEWMAWATAGLLLLAFISHMQSRATHGEMRRSYERSITPHLTWQDPRAEQQSNDDWDFWAEYTFAVRSVGPGDARLKSYEAKMVGPGEAFPIYDLVPPSTLPVGAQYKWRVIVPKLVERHADTDNPDQELRLTLGYSDLQGLHNYETYATFVAGLGSLRYRVNAFKDVDERPAEKRRVVPKVGWFKRWRRNVGGWIAGG